MLGPVWVGKMHENQAPLVAPGPVGSYHTHRMFSSLMVKGTEPALWEQRRWGRESVWGVRTSFLEGAAFSFFL